MTPNTLLGEALTAWSDARDGVIAEVKNIAVDQLDYQPADATVVDVSRNRA